MKSVPGIDGSQSPSLTRAIALLIMQVLASIGGTTIVFFLLFNVAGCGDRCNYDLVNFAWAVQRGACGLTFVASLLTMILGRRQARNWWGTGLGLLLVIVVSVVNIVLINVATVGSL